MDFNMAGHSKFKNIMHRKGAQDAKKAKIFTKIGREIQVAASIGGGDPATNPRLRSALAEARQNNMTNDRIKKAIDAGMGVGDMSNYVLMRYEGYASGGVAVIVEALTDNKNRTAGEVRAIFSKFGGNLGETGSVGFMFDHIGLITYPLDKGNADQMFEAGVEAGADNVETTEEAHEISTSVGDLMAVAEQLEKRFGAAASTGMVWKPNVMTAIDAETATSVLKLVDGLEDCDDVQKVYTNFEVSDADMQKLIASG